MKKFLGACRGERRANKTFCIDGLKGILLCSSSRLNLQLRDGSLDLIYTKASIFGREDGVFFFCSLFCFLLLLVLSEFVIYCRCLTRAIGLAIPVHNNLTLDKIEARSASSALQKIHVRCDDSRGSMIVFKFSRPHC